MKTQIDINSYIFSNRPQLLKRQISDDPDTGFIRVIELQRAELCFDIDLIQLHAKTYYINPINKKLIPQLTQKTINNGGRWEIAKGELTTKINENFEPIPNPDYNSNELESLENTKYLMVDAYEQFSSILLNPSIIISLPTLWFLFVDFDDEKELFNFIEEV